MNYKEVEISLYVYINIHSYTMNKTIVNMQCIYRRGPGRLVINTYRHVKTEAMHTSNGMDR